MKFRKLMIAVALTAAAASASATTFVNFIIDGDTFLQPFRITNASTTGESILAVHLDLGPANAVFDTISGGVPNNTNGKPFTPRNAAEVGLKSPSTIDDGASILDMTFNDFNAFVFGGSAAETFEWDIDVDSKDGTIDTILGNQLAGATVWVDFSNGERLLGVMVAVGASNPDASTFMATGRVPTPTPNPTPVPEPGSLALAGLALLALGASRGGAKRI